MIGDGGGGQGAVYGKPSEINTTACSFSTSTLSFAFGRSGGDDHDHSGSFMDKAISLATPSFGMAMCASPPKQWERSVSEDKRQSNSRVRPRRSQEELFDAYSSVGRLVEKL
jgi:hypothetical protein